MKRHNYLYIQRYAEFSGQYRLFTVKSRLKRMVFRICFLYEYSIWDEFHTVAGNLLQQQI